MDEDVELQQRNKDENRGNSTANTTNQASPDRFASGNKYSNKKQKSNESKYYLQIYSDLFNSSAFNH